MRIFLSLLSLGFLLAALGIFSASKSAIHEIEALLFVLIGSVFLCAVAVLEEMRRSRAAALPRQNTTKVPASTESRDNLKGQCPSCGLLNPRTALRCDCGYQLT